MIKRNKRGNSYARFSTIGIQMGIIIGLFAWGGVKLDEKYLNNYRMYTVIGSLLGVFIAMYLLIKEVINMGKNDED